MSPKHDPAGRDGSPDTLGESRFWLEDGSMRGFLAAIVDSSDDAIVGKTLEGVIRSWNPGAERLFGYSAREAIGRTIHLIIPRELWHEEDEILARVSRGERIGHYETERVTRDGRRLQISLTVSPIRDRDGRIVGASKVGRDVGPRRRAERQAAEARRTLQAVVDAAPVSIVVVDEHGVVHLWNAAATRLYGWAREEVIGRVTPVVPADRNAELLDNIRRTLDGDPLRGEDAVRRHRDGHPVEVAFWTSPLPGDPEQPRRLVSIAADVSAQRAAERELRESEERFRTLADNIAQFAWMADGDGQVFWYNERWFEYTGTTLEQAEGWGWREVHHPDHVDRVTATYRRAIETKQEWEETFPLRGRDGRFRWFLTRAIPIRDAEGRIFRWFGTNTDITERREMEEALREADRRKDQFLATLAHELRNPLAPIVNGIELLGVAGDDASVLSRVKETLERQSGHLMRLVDDLLDISRVNLGKVTLRRETIDLRSAVEAAVEATRPLLAELRHDVRVRLPDDPVLLEADPTRLTQVFSNLLNNAGRYTPPGGIVEVSAEPRDGEVWVTVTDTGAGLDPEMLSRVFDLFIQGEEERPGAASGLGIGLTLVRALVELHGGRVEASSPGAGRGSSFTVTLPRRTGDGRGSAGARRHPGPVETRRLRVLVADDNRDAADALQELLSQAGHEAVAAYDGDQALEAARSLRPDLVLLDLGMPPPDGYETARRLRREPWGESVVLAALTGWGQAEDRRRTREAGFDHHLVKPATRRQLERLLADLSDAQPREP